MCVLAWGIEGGSWETLTPYQGSFQENLKAEWVGVVWVEFVTTSCLLSKSGTPIEGMGRVPC